ncbi:MAG: TIGR03905 family TSCPD domain-containing protein [Oscillospiraceae bacterium]
MEYSRKNSGTCSTKTMVDIEGGIVRKIEFTGGCNGNLKGIAKLCEGMRAADVIARVKGITCGYKSTSCPDQLALALEEALLAQEK